MKTDKTGLYIDLCTLRKTFFRATYEMTQKDRIIFADRVLAGIADTLAEFVLGFEYPEDREEHIKKMTARFTIAKTDIRIMAEEHIFKGKKTKDGLSTIYERDIFTLVGRIDEGINKWRSAYIRGRASSAKGEVD